MEERYKGYIQETKNGKPDTYRLVWFDTKDGMREVCSQFLTVRGTAEQVDISLKMNLQLLRETNAELFEPEQTEPMMMEDMERYGTV